MRKINSRFHIDDNEIIKTSNNQIIPHEEPLFLMRGRDHLTLKFLKIYKDLCIEDGCNSYFLKELDKTIKEFELFNLEYSERLKQPGITKGL